MESKIDLYKKGHTEFGKCANSDSAVFTIDDLIDTLQCLFVIDDHVALDRHPGPGYNTLLL